MGEAVLADCRADGDAQLAFAVEAEIANRAAVRPARNRLQFVNDFHGADFRRAGDAAARKSRRERGKMRHVLPQPAFDGGNEVLHLRESFQLGDFRRLHGAEFADLAQIISEQVRDHHQFGEFLGIGLEFVGELRVARRVGIARARALDGSRDNVRTAHAQELFRRRRRDLEIAAIEKRGKRRWRDGAQCLKQFPAGSRSAGLPTGVFLLEFKLELVPRTR